GAESECERERGRRGAQHALARRRSLDDDGPAEKPTSQDDAGGEIEPSDRGERGVDQLRAPFTLKVKRPSVGWVSTDTTAQRTVYSPAGRDGSGSSSRSGAG